jgi:hypothetical protein
MDLKSYTVTVTLSITVQIDEDVTTLADFITDLNYEFESQTEGAEILYINFLDAEKREED